MPSLSIILMRSRSAQNMSNSAGPSPCLTCSDQYRSQARLSDGSLGGSSQLRSTLSWSIGSSLKAGSLRLNSCLSFENIKLTSVIRHSSSNCQHPTAQDTGPFGGLWLIKHLNA